MLIYSIPAETTVLKNVLFMVGDLSLYTCGITLIFRSGSKSGDFHDDLNHANYMKCLQEKFIPNLESKSVIDVDNASHHNVQLNRHPTSNAKKGETLFWLGKCGIRYSSDMTNQSCRIS